MEVIPPVSDEYHPCINLCSTGDSAEIVPGEPLSWLLLRYDKWSLLNWKILIAFFALEVNDALDLGEVLLGLLGQRVVQSTQVEGLLTFLQKVQLQVSYAKTKPGWGRARPGLYSLVEDHLCILPALSVQVGQGQSQVDRVYLRAMRLQLEKVEKNFLTLEESLWFKAYISLNQKEFNAFWVLLYELLHFLDCLVISSLRKKNFSLGLLSIVTHCHFW